MLSLDSLDSSAAEGVKRGGRGEGLVSCGLSDVSCPVTTGSHSALNAPSPESCKMHPVLYSAALSTRLRDQDEEEEEKEEEEGRLSEVLSRHAVSIDCADWIDWTDNICIAEDANTIPSPIGRTLRSSGRTTGTGRDNSRYLSGGVSSARSFFRCAVVSPPPLGTLWHRCTARWYFCAARMHSALASSLCGDESIVYTADGGMRTSGGGDDSRGLGVILRLSNSSCSVTLGALFDPCAGVFGVLFAFWTFLIPSGGSTDFVVPVVK